MILVLLLVLLFIILFQRGLAFSSSRPALKSTAKSPAAGDSSPPTKGSSLTLPEASPETSPKISEPDAEPEPGVTPSSLVDSDVNDVNDVNALVNPNLNSDSSAALSPVASALPPTRPRKRPSPGSNHRVLRTRVPR